MKKKVLVVDDNYLNIRLLGDILSDENFEVFSADNGLDVLKITREKSPDVILLDIMMPGLDGFEVCKLLKEQYELKDIPVIMVTAKTEGTDLKKAFENGAFDYIKKPIDEVEVIARVRSALRYKEQQDQLVERASRDGLTGLYTHAVLIELFEKEIAKQERNLSTISFVMLDIDFFKHVNDSYGHVCGDEILRELSYILMSSVRKGDIVGRYGGEEFGLAVLNLEKEDIFKICERIRRKIEEHSFTFEDKLIKVTVSMGVVFKDIQDKITVENMIKKADEALYIAKNSGRNRVEIISSASC